ncbi:PREDICTED: uncharacterized protein LOC105360372 [Ceratosolen solmsi marchali]|uniref:Uncharacterized protein LOC105360372 n=1 Tax=Ceratosolen solmsi marchali TaxID=326594 RepID=A0AAJ6YCY4_9HYME|nr:PREDICTED: uncharacterized protein LOC105360372 [Ceratosolen solmsi marchali]
MAGWGISNDNNTPAIMETVELKVLSIAECEDKIERLHGSRVPVNYRQICSSADPYALMSSGDSGGPLLSMGMVIGVNTATVPVTVKVPHPDKVNVHAGIEYYRAFILEAIGSSFVWS